jgi:hypothetical protein
VNRSWYSARCRDEFEEAIEKATADGTLAEWTWGQLLGKWAPPGTREHDAAHHREYETVNGLKRLAD